jgi:hypothetical protein
MADCVNPDKCLPESALLSLRMSNAWLVGPDIKRTLRKAFGTGVVTNKTLDTNVVYRAMLGLGLPVVIMDGLIPTNYLDLGPSHDSPGDPQGVSRLPQRSQKTAAMEFAPEHVHLLDAKDPWLSFTKLGDWGQRREQEVRHLQPRQKLYLAIHSLTSLMVVVDSVIGLFYSQGEELPIPDGGQPG